MAGLVEGYVIPRLIGLEQQPGHVPQAAVIGGATGGDVHRWQAGTQNGSSSYPHAPGNSTAQNGLYSDHGFADVARSNVHKQYAMIYSRRCIHCRNFHDPNKYCFRLKLLNMSPHKGKKRSRRDVSTDTDTDTSTGELQDSDARRASDSSSNSDSDGDSEQERKEDGHGPPFGNNLSAFYDSKKRVDHHEIKLVLQPETIKMYFDNLLSDGKLNIESSKELHKKYFMSDKDFQKIAPPSLSSTKLRDIQHSDLGGIHNRLMGIHVSMRTALKIALRSYESLGGTSAVFEEFVPVHPYSIDEEVSNKFVLPSKQDMLLKVTDEEIRQEMPADAAAITELVRDRLMYEKLADKQASMYVEVLRDLNTAEEIALIGQKQQVCLVDLMWDFLQYLGQLDLTIKDAREAKIEEYLTAGFKSSLKASNRDKDVRKERHKKDVLLHPRLDKFVKEEARSNTKVCLFSINVSN